MVSHYTYELPSVWEGMTAAGRLEYSISVLYIDVWLQSMQLCISLHCTFHSQLVT